MSRHTAIFGVSGSRILQRIVSWLLLIASSTCARRWRAWPERCAVKRSGGSGLLWLIQDWGRTVLKADQVLAIVSSICTWYQSRDDDYVSPIVKRMRRTKQKEAGAGGIGLPSNREPQSKDLRLPVVALHRFSSLSEGRHLAPAFLSPVEANTTRRKYRSKKCRLS
jgi:hypothetical protein